VLLYHLASWADYELVFDNKQIEFHKNEIVKPVAIPNVGSRYADVLALNNANFNLLPIYNINLILVSKQ